MNQRSLLLISHWIYKVNVYRFVLRFFRFNIYAAVKFGMQNKNLNYITLFSPAQMRQRVWVCSDEARGPAAWHSRRWGLSSLCVEVEVEVSGSPVASVVGWARWRGCFGLKHLGKWKCTWTRSLAYGWQASSCWTQLGSARCVPVRLKTTTWSQLLDLLTKPCWFLKLRWGDGTHLCQGRPVKNPPIVLVRLHPGKFCYCYWQHFLLCTSFRAAGILWHWEGTNAECSGNIPLHACQLITHSCV